MEQLRAKFLPLPLLTLSATHVLRDPLDLLTVPLTVWHGLSLPIALPTLLTLTLHVKLVELPLLMPAALRVLEQHPLDQPMARRIALL